MENLGSFPESRSSSVRETITGSHRYTVKGYSLFKGMGPKKYISSDVFAVGGCDWSIRFYPDGEKVEDSSTYLSVFLDMVSKETELKVVFDFSLLDQSGTQQHFTCGPSKNGPHTFTNKSPSLGYAQFIERSNLESSKYIKEDCLVIRCRIGIVKNSNEQTAAFPIPIPPSNLGQCFRGFLESGTATDVVFKIGDEAFKAHKLILAARSPVFEAQFYGPLGNPTVEEIIVQDIPAPVFQALLEFIYSDSLPDLNEMGSSSSSSTILAQHLLAAADIYGFERLKLFCEDKLSRELTADTVVSTLGLADQHHFHHLKYACMNFLASHKNLGAVVTSEGFQNLKNSPALLMELLRAMASDGNY